MRKLASIVTISKLTPIENADRLEVAEMAGKGWKVVVQKNEFSPFDKAVYFEIDSALPYDDERYAFLRERCTRKMMVKGEVVHKVIRIKTVKLRGVVSQGLLIPLSKFDEITKAMTNVDGKDMLYNTVRIESNDTETVYVIRLEEVDGADVSTLLNIEHFDEVVERYAPLEFRNPLSSDAYGRFPTDWIPRTDEERIQNLAEYFEKYAGHEFEVTSKDDGSSVTMFYSPRIDEENAFGVCSRNIRLKPISGDGTIPLPWRMAEKYAVCEKLKRFYEETGNEYAVQGELIGPGIQKNRDKYTDHEWHVFKIYDICAQRYLLPSERREFCNRMGLQHVAVAHEALDIFGQVNVKDEHGNIDISASMNAILKFAEGKTDRGFEREGFVFKSTTNPHISFKAVSNRYLLKQEE